MNALALPRCWIELDRIATEAGVKQLPSGYSEQDIEGSDSIKMVTVTEGLRRQLCQSGEVY